MPSSTAGPTVALPTIALALVVLGVLAVGGGRAWSLLGMAPGTVLPAGAAAAVASSTSAIQPPSPGGAAAPAVESGPDWSTLTTPQKLALYPLAERWAVIGEPQKRRWLALAQNFSALAPDEQERMHARMTDWASLSAQQRNQARLNFAVSNKLAPDDKRAQWEAYLALSEEERLALAARAAPKPQGAAPALRPVPPQKLAQVPAAAQAGPDRRNPPKIPPVVDHSPRVAAPVPVHAAPGHADTHAPGATAAVETAPVAVPVAEPSALPPLGASSSPETAAPVAPAVTPDTSGLYPQ